MYAALRVWAKISRAVAVLPAGRYLRHALGLVFCAAVLGLVIASLLLPLPAELSVARSTLSVRVDDRNGTVLREVRSARGALSQWVPLEKLPILLPRALIAIEDRHFYYHPGVDPLATLRAIGQALISGQIVSGASTITMQLARTLVPHQRNLWGKLHEAALALRIEASLSKAEILEQYLNRVDFGPNLRGVSAAAQGYFGQPVSSLSPAQIALLAGLPQSPSGYEPYRYEARARKRRSRVLHQLRDDQVLVPELVEAAEQESLALPARPRAFGAPHFVSALMQGALVRLQPALSDRILKRATRLRTTIDPLLQHAAETALASAIHQLRFHRVTSGAVLALDNATGDVLAYVGSPDFYDEGNHGQVDSVRALRQPGSTLKPFLYAAAFDELGYTPATVLPDLALRIETKGGAYSPRNFDEKFRGPVRLREALGNSLNVPAVHTAMRLGTASLLEALRRLEFASLSESPDYYGPALALGDGEVTLVELTRAYSTLARGGRSLPLRVVSDVTLAESVGSRLRESSLALAPGESRRVLSEANAALITDILKDKAARSATFGVQSPLEFDFDVAAKTGTSKGFRDNWVVGYSSRITVGVWVGNWDGSPMREVSGISGAGPIFRAIMLAAHSTRLDAGLPLQSFESKSQLAHRLGVERVEICEISGLLRGPHCPHSVLEYVPTNRDLPSCDWHRQVPIDNRNGLLAGPNCPSTFAVARTFEVFPEEYSSWAASVGRSHMPTEVSPECPSEFAPSSRDELAIVQPQFGSRFVIDPERTSAQQALKVEGTAPRSVQVCELLVDDKLVATKTRPFEFFWGLTPGHHRLQLRTETLTSAVVEIDVRRSDAPQ